MATGSERRKVLIIEDEPAIRNVLFVLLAGLGCEGDVAYTGQQALSMVSRESFDAVLLDLRCNNLGAEQVVSQIKDISPSLVGRVLVITGEVTDPETMELISRHLLPHIPHNRLMPELFSKLRRILGLNASPNHANS
ncbi:MAG: response regulator [Acidobacteriia bacterium]|nr:response regulator [Terriglobia bacterium]